MRNTKRGQGENIDFHLCGVRNVSNRLLIDWVGLIVVNPTQSK